MHENNEYDDEYNNEYMNEENDDENERRKRFALRDRRGRGRDEKENRFEGENPGRGRPSGDNTDV